MKPVTIILIVVGVVIVLAAIALVIYFTVAATPNNPYGTIFASNTNPNAGLWSDPQTWTYKVPPVASSTVQIDVANGYVQTTPGSICTSLTVGRHALNNQLIVQNSDLTVSQTLWIGQYIDGSGSIQMGEDGVINCGSLRVGLNGTGNIIMNDNSTLSCSTTADFNHYMQNTLAPAYVQMSGSALFTAGSLLTNINSYISIDENAQLVLSGNILTTVNSLITSKWLRSINSTLTASYNSTTNVTTVSCIVASSSSST